MSDGEQYASKRPSREKSHGEETTEAGGLRGGLHTGDVECESGTGRMSKLSGSGSNGADSHDKSVSSVRRSNAMRLSNDPVAAGGRKSVPGGIERQAGIVGDVVSSIQ